MKRAALALLLACSAACASDGSPASPDLSVNPRCARPAPLLGEPNPATADSYIVLFHDGVDAKSATARLAARHGFTPRYVYEHALSGFSAVMPRSAVAGIRCESVVKYVEHDGIASGG